MVFSGLCTLMVAVLPDVATDASRSVLSPQPVMTCISTLVRLFQVPTSEAATWMVCAVLSAPVSRLKLNAPLLPRFGLRARMALTPLTYSCRNGVVMPLAV
jgi:hypothetical protein